MAAEVFLQNWVVTKFILPFLLLFFIVFGILEKTKVFGESNKQLNAFISLIIGLIFVGAVFPKLVVENMILFLTVAVVVLFVALILWGFISGEEGLKFGNMHTALKWTIGIAVVIATLIALLFATGVEYETTKLIIDALFGQSWSQTFWTNMAFVAVIVIAVVLILKDKGSSSH